MKPSPLFSLPQTKIGAWREVARFNVELILVAKYSNSFPLQFTSSWLTQFESVSATCGLLKYNNSFSGIKLLVEIDGRQTRISDKPNYSYPIFRRGNEQQLDNFNKDRCMYRFILPRTLGHMGQQFPTNKAGAVFEFSITNERVTLGISNIVRNGCFFFGTVASIYCNNMFGYVGFLRKVFYFPFGSFF